MKELVSFQHLDIGSRSEQQDACVSFASPDGKGGFYVVADGVGGQSGGQLASNVIVVEATKRWNGAIGITEPRSFLLDFAQTSHDQINQIGTETGSRPRATVVALLIRNGQAHWIHSGDSRLYHFRDGKLVERTLDHSVVQILVEQGKLAEDEMGTHPDQGRLLQSLGGEDYETPDYRCVDLAEGDSFLLCTDGFWERATPEELRQTASNPAGWTSGAPRLASQVVSRGGDKADNLSLILVSASTATSLEAIPKPVESGTGAWRRAPVMGFVICGLLGILIGLGIAVVWPKLSGKSSTRAEDAAAPKANPEEVTPTVQGSVESVSDGDISTPGAVARPPDEDGTQSSAEKTGGATDSEKSAKDDTDQGESAPNDNGTGAPPAKPEPASDNTPIPAESSGDSDQKPAETGAPETNE